MKYEFYFSRILHVNLYTHIIISPLSIEACFHFNLILAKHSVFQSVSWTLKQSIAITDMNKPGHASSKAYWSPRKWRIWSTKMADHQHFQYINKRLYFKKIYGKSKLWLKAYSYPRKGHYTWSTKMATMSFKIWLLGWLHAMRDPGLFISVIGIYSRSSPLKFVYPRMSHCARYWHYLSQSIAFSGQ